MICEYCGGDDCHTVGCPTLPPDRNAAVPVDTVEEIIAVLRAYSLKHYEDGGWDVIYEAWDDSELKEFFIKHSVTTPEQAIKAFKPLVAVWADRQADAHFNGADEAF